MNSRHSAAEATFDDAKAKLQRHHLEANLDADEKVRTKLEAAVGACAVTRDGDADALAEVQTKIAIAEQQLAAERAALSRKTASEKLAPANTPTTSRRSTTSMNRSSSGKRQRW